MSEKLFIACLLPAPSIPGIFLSNVVKHAGEPNRPFYGVSLETYAACSGRIDLLDVSLSRRARCDRLCIESLAPRVSF